MKKYRFSSKIMGIFRVSGANFFSLFVSLLTSFLLPYFITVEDYGYWQLFVLYSGYAGFFAFGFNDGIHLNYATCSYNKDTTRKFKTFLLLLLTITIAETVCIITIITFLLQSSDEKFYVYLFTVLAIIPTIICGLFTYMNQATMRFKKYAWGLIVDKIVFAVLMIILLITGCRNYKFFIGAYIISRYTVILYHFFSSRLVFESKSHKIRALLPEIEHNFTSGFALMIATILNGSIIVGSRLLIENKFGIAEFSAYSFSIHTLVVASQFITAIASVFYPIMKRCEKEELPKIYNTFDQASSVLSALLLISYFPAAILVALLYKKYNSILDYLFFVYPLFIFQCKSNLLIINTYKVRNEPIKLIIINAAGIIIHFLFALVFYFMFGSVMAIAISVLISYGIWYYLTQIFLYKESGWNFHLRLFSDVLVISIFILCNLISSKVMHFNELKCIISSFVLFSISLGLIWILSKGHIKAIIHQTAFYLKD